MKIPSGISIERIVKNLCDIAVFGADYKAHQRESPISMDEVCKSVSDAFKNARATAPIAIAFDAIPDLKIIFNSITDFDVKAFDQKYGNGMAGLAIEDAIAMTVHMNVTDKARQDH